MAKDSKTTTRNAQGRREVVESQYGVITQKQLNASLTRVKNMTHAELVESLKTSGVLTPSGKQLAKRYRS